MLDRIRSKKIPMHKELSMNSPLKYYLEPSFVYYPIDISNIKCKVLVNVGDEIKKGQPILLREGRFMHFISSSVSGTLIGIKKMWHSSGRIMDCLEIKNDFNETLFYETNPLENLTKDAIIERVKDAGIVGLGGAGFPTYVKYLPQQASDYVIINAAECEPYITSDYVSMLNFARKVISGIKYIMIANNSKHAFIAIKKERVLAIEALTKELEGIDNISLFLLPNVYPAGWERYLVTKIIKKSYRALPREVSTTVNNLRTCLAVCDAVEENKPLIETVVTISGEMVKEPCNVVVKIGTKVSDIIKFIGGFTDDIENGNSLLIAGGPMMGSSIPSEDLVVTAVVNAVTIIKAKEKPYTNNCISCGRCANSCPANLTPSLIKQAYLSDNISNLIRLNVNKCIKCGLCSYVCPSRVEMTYYMDLAKKKLQKAQDVNKVK